MQMYLNRGEYGGYRFIHDETIDFFTSQQEDDSRRGLGFDKPENNPDKDSPVSRMASAKSYGHSGFTGTIVWVDPTYDLIFIFLSNRIHPDSFNRKLSLLNVRTKIQDVIYRSIIDWKHSAQGFTLISIFRLQVEEGTKGLNHVGMILNTRKLPYRMHSQHGVANVNSSDI